MTKTELKDKLKQLNLSQKEFARFSGCSYQSVKQWKEHKVPNWVSIVIEYMEMLQAAKKIICKKQSR